MNLIKKKPWFLIQYKHNRHKLAESNLARQGFKTFIPLQETTIRKASKFIQCLRPLFPGYLFVTFDPTTCYWRTINGTLGVNRLVCIGNQPIPIPSDFIAALMQRCDKFGILMSLEGLQLQPGFRVQVLKGPFANFVGKLEDLDTNKRACILMEIMGQKARVNLASNHIN
tara:strand:+ start:1398 stop:1907 length:510 start_codon:yes stop_codon:yes gene_type:complete